MFLKKDTERQFLAQYSEYLFVFLFIASLICIELWPWPLKFANGFPDHFDPPFHAWKLQVLADKIVNQHELMPDAETNIYYPYAHELYFDALLWPQGILAAILHVFGAGPILVYNLVLLFFWALSGLFMFLLLKSLGLSRAASFFGGAAFCLIPYRTSYFVEFNMEMAFGIPFFLLCWIHFYRRPSPGRGALLAFAFWLQAVSELYQAIILVLSFPLIALPFLPDLWREHRRSWNFFASLVTALMVVTALCLLYLGPYFSLFHQGYNRHINEMFQHSLEPLAYVGHQLINLLPGVDFKQMVKHDEMCAFPSFTVLLLALGYGFSLRRIAGGGPNCKEHIGFKALRWLRLIALVCLGLLLIYLSTSTVGQDNGNFLLLLVGNGTLAVALGATIILSLRDSQRNLQRQFLGGLAGVALLCWIISFGPFLRVLNTQFTVVNWIFEMVATSFPLNGLRVMSRFSVMVMFFLTAISAVFLHKCIKSDVWRGWLTCVLLLLLIGEGASVPHGFKVFPHSLSPQVADAIAQHRENSLAVIPLGNRDYDPGYMLDIAKTGRLLVNGWGGFVPPLTHEIGYAMRNDPVQAFELLRTLWPDVILVVDRKALALEQQLEDYALTEDFIRTQGRLLAEGQLFSIYTIDTPSKPVNTLKRIIRPDLLKKNGVFSLTARCAEGAPCPLDVFLMLNERLIGVLKITDKWQTQSVIISEQFIADRGYEELVLQSADSAKWYPLENTFQPAPMVPQLPVEKMKELSQQVTKAGLPPWIVTLNDLPEKTVKTNIVFNGGMKLAGYEVQVHPATTGVTAEIIQFWQYPADSIVKSYVLKTEVTGEKLSKRVQKKNLSKHQPLNKNNHQGPPVYFVERMLFELPRGVDKNDIRVRIALGDAEKKKTLSANKQGASKDGMISLPVGEETGRMQEK